MVSGKYEKQLKNVFFAIAIITILVVTIASSLFISNQLQSQYDDNLIEIVNSHKTYSEISITTIFSTIDSLSQNAEIMNWSVANTRTDYYYDSIKVKDTLGLLRQSFPTIPIYPAVTKLDDDSFVISSFGTHSKSEYFNAETTLDDEQQQYILDYFSANFGTLILSTYDINNNLSDLYYIFKHPYSTTELLYIVRIPRTSIFLNNTHEQFILYNDEQIIAYSDISEDTVNLMSEVYSDVLVNSYSENELGIQTIYENNYTIYTMDFNRSNWNVSFVYEKTNINAIKIITYIIVPVILMCIILYYVSKFISAWLYKPFKEILPSMINSDCEGNIDEFHLIKENSATAENLSNALQEILQENTSLLYQRFYRDLILGLNVSENKIYDKIPRESKSFTIALFEFYDAREPVLNEDIFFIKNALISHVQQNDSIYVVNVSRKECVLIIESKTQNEAMEKLRSINIVFSGQWEYKIALSDTRLGYEHIRDSYKECLHIIEYKYLYSSENILTSAQIAIDNWGSYHYPISIENRMIYAVLEGNIIALKIFDELIDDNYNNRNLSVESIKGFIFALLGSTSRIFQEMKLPPEILLGHEINYDQLYSNWNDPHTIEIIRCIISESIESIGKKNKLAGTNTIQAMKQYIYDNYDKDITLEDLAESLNISAKYSSNLFKKLNNDTFKNYLNSYRIEKAKEIIAKDPNIKIVNLYPQVGFNSSNTFIRVFGKYAGVTPGTYALMFTKKEDTKDI